MFDWLGFRKGLPLWLSYQINRGMKEDVEEIFEGIASTRRDLLEAWAHDYWGHLERLEGEIRAKGYPENASEGTNGASCYEELFTSCRGRAEDFSEIALIDPSGAVNVSTYRSNLGKNLLTHGVLSEAMERVRHGEKCLVGPYADPLTEEIGPSTSRFHDEMTLMFLHPVMEGKVLLGVLCGRVPNDVLGDLIQRESGHVYPDSGDNYLFMAKPELRRDIKPGTALSRSRFEDLTFTHGDNLKEGVKTEFGVVQVQNHTELELVFVDPATGQLHPGVAGTITNGSNLFVEFPGYSDYRHIPVIGKGITFKLPHCPDLWGMMCEGDLEEVYRVRSLHWKVKVMHLWLVAGFVLMNVLMAFLLGNGTKPLISVAAFFVMNVLYGAAGVYLIERRQTLQAAKHLRRLNRFIRINAEGKGDLTKRLDIDSFPQDETGEMAKWINNMIDSLEGIMLHIRRAADDVRLSQSLLHASAASTEESTDVAGNKVDDMLRGIRRQLADIDMAKDVSLHMSGTLKELEQQASEQIAVAQNEVVRIGDKMQHIHLKVEETNRTLRDFAETTQEIASMLKVIEEISAQTNLLSLNASIEAARVGEHGRGFAVVAGEIRKLAELTSRSTASISDTLKRIDEKAEESFQTMEEGSKVVEEGTQLVATAAQILQQAGASDSLKTQVVDEMVSLMEQIAAVSMENRKISTEVEDTVQLLSRDMQQVRSTTGHVESITSSLLQLVNQFQLRENKAG